MRKVQYGIKNAPGLKEIESLFSPPTPSTPVANNISMKLPAFWPDVAEVWFAQADAQFAIRIISISKTKFYQAVAVLPQKIASQILVHIRAPPAGDPYEILREQLITLYTLNNYERF